LRALSRDLGDEHRISDTTLAAACAADGVALALLAWRDGKVIGALLSSPVMSTTQGGPGLYVSDLWVSPDMRGEGLGRRLLREAATVAAGRWGALFLRLTVYEGNEAARRMYARCGFTERPSERIAILHGSAWDRLVSPPQDGRPPLESPGEDG
jgi:ribosomal protein S18 acetylase RimI-like enzyme